MNRSDNITVSFRLQPDTVKMFDRYSHDTGISKSFTVNKLLSDFLVREGYSVSDDKEVVTRQTYVC